jgi:hypothetical protein
MLIKCAFVGQKTLIHWTDISRYWEVFTDCDCDRVIQYAGAVSRVLVKQSWRLNLVDKKHMLADVAVCCATTLPGSIVPSHCWFRDRVGLPRIPQAQSLDNSMPYHINTFMNADDDCWGCDVQFCGERICYQVFIYRVIQEEGSIFWGVIVWIIVRKKVHMNLCLILNGYRDGAVWISTPDSVIFLFVRIDEERSL